MGRLRGWWTRSVVLCLVLAGSLLPAAPAAASPPGAAPGAVAITRLDAYRFQGWGTTLAWWANVVGGWSAANRQPDYSPQKGSSAAVWTECAGEWTRRATLLL